MSGLGAWVGSCWGRALPASVLRSSSGGLAVSPTQLRHFRANQPPVQFRVLAGPWALEPAHAVEVRRGGAWHLQAPPSSPGPRGAALPPGPPSPQPTATASQGQGDMTNLFPGPPRRAGWWVSLHYLGSRPDPSGGPGPDGRVGPMGAVGTEGLGSCCGYPRLAGAVQTSGGKGCVQVHTWWS